MKADEWKKVKEIFNRAVEMPAAEREEFLLSFQNGDAHIRREVEKLLAADENSDAKFEDFSFVSITNSKDKIGRYKILREIGAGGMGAVYLAEREDLPQKVALKIIRRGAGSDTVLRRFRKEQEILAALEHPNIARLLDAGLSAEGLPFLAMEYVEGSDLLTYCAEKNLSLNDKLKLFRKICDAVAYAHSRLVVHRDLKPSNILVNEKGEPKLLDFGISKLLSENNLEEKGTVTSFGMLTPNYASPEQFRGESVSTATDVYSLGVILYELLTGKLPYDVENRRYEEVARIVCETNPQKPSDAVTLYAEAETRGNKEPETSGNRKSQTTSRRLLRGDLDNILLKALRKEPERRYSSIEKFSDDLRRHLEGLPVTARPDIFSYRAEKFVKRNRTAVFAASLVLLSLVGGISTTSYQTVRAERQRALAEKRFNEVRQIANNVVFKYHDEIESVPGTTKVREILIKDAIEYLDRLAQDSADDISLKRELAKSYLRIGSLQGGIRGASGIGETSDAIVSDQKAVALLEEASQKSGDPAILEELRTAYADLGLIFNRAGDERKIEYAEKALALSERLCAAEPENIERQILLAADYISLGDVTPNDDLSAVNKAEVYFGNNRLYRHGLEIIESILARAPENERALQRKMQATSRLSANYQLAADAANSRNDLRQRDEYGQQALDFIRQARESCEKLLVAKPDNADWQFNLSSLRWNESLIELIMGNTDAALKIQVEIIQKVEKVSAGDPNDIDALHGLVVMYDGYASALNEAKNFNAALDYQQKALAIIESLVEKDAENLEFRQTRRDVINRKAEIMASKGETEESVKIFRTAYRQYLATPMLKDKAAERDYYEGLMHKRIGNVYQRATETSGIGKEKLRAQLQNAIDNYQLALEHWQKPETVAEFFETDHEQLENLHAKMEECKERLAGL